MPLRLRLLWHFLAALFRRARSQSSALAAAQKGLDRPKP